MARPMRSEKARLETFRTWPPSIGVSPLQLASAGFFYTGNDDQVTCFSCRGRIMAWQAGDVPLEEHRKHFPQCPFLTNAVQAGNILYTFDGSDESDGRSLSMQASGAQGETFSDLAAINGLDHPGTGQSNFQGANESDYVTTVKQARSHRDMNQEANRLSSLKDWPKRHIISPMDVARAGLYYTGEEDKLRCAFCAGQMVNWERGDSPAEEHKKHFGARCPFLKGQNSNNPASSTLISLNIVTDKPQHREYSSEDSRVNSFRNWNHGHIQSPQVLAKAGFFFTGTEDSVRCFFCGVGLRNWEAVDLPLQEHKKWAPNCGFLRYLGQPREEQDMEQMDSEDLEVQNRRLREERVCKACGFKESNMVFLPCGHIVTCEECSSKVKDCLRCHEAVKGTVKAYMT